MNDSIQEEQLTAARAYESLFVPALFGPWAPRVVEAADIRPGQRVLDVACGTGVLAREALAKVQESGYVAGLDPVPGMLALGKELEPTVDWREGVAESIPFPDASFDVVVSQFGLMFFADRARAIGEMLRVLKPSGRLVVAVWDSLDNVPAYAAAAELLDRLAGTDAANALRAPFVLGDKAELESLFLGAGAPSVTITTLPGRIRFPSVHVMVEAELRGWLPVMGVELEESLIRRILDEAETALGDYVSDEGTAEFDSSAHLVTVAGS